MKVALVVSVLVSLLTAGLQALWFNESILSIYFITLEHFNPRDGHHWAFIAMQFAPIIPLTIMTIRVTRRWHRGV